MNTVITAQAGRNARASGSTLIVDRTRYQIGTYEAARDLARRIRQAAEDLHHARPIVITQKVNALGNPFYSVTKGQRMMSDQELLAYTSNAIGTDNAASALEAAKADFLYLSYQIARASTASALESLIAPILDDAERVARCMVETTDLARGGNPLAMRDVIAATYAYKALLLAQSKVPRG